MGRVEEAGEDKGEVVSNIVVVGDYHIILLGYNSIISTQNRRLLTLYLDPLLVGDFQGLQRHRPAGNIDEEEVVEGHPFVPQQVEAQFQHLAAVIHGESLFKHGHSSE